MIDNCMYIDLHVIKYNLACLVEWFDFNLKFDPDSEVSSLMLENNKVISKLKMNDHNEMLRKIKEQFEMKVIIKKFRIITINQGATKTTATTIQQFFKRNHIGKAILDIEWVIISGMDQINIKNQTIWAKVTSLKRIKINNGPFEHMDIFFTNVVKAKHLTFTIYLQ